MAKRTNFRLTTVAILAVLTFCLSSPYVQGEEIIIGTGTSTWEFPLFTEYHNARTQTIYLASELGSPYRITGLALYVTQVPWQTINSFTIRMKHTDLGVYSASPVWESLDWTTVYQANERITALGWVQFNFITPFEYNGYQNLMLDISFNNDSYTNNGQSRYSVPGGNRTICYVTYSYDGDPLVWSGTTPRPYLSTYVPNIKLITEPSKVALPVFSPDGGVYTSDQSVVITCSTPEATIHYTTSGVDPTEADPVIISGESVLVSIEPHTTLKARAWKTGVDVSEVRTALYRRSHAGTGTRENPYLIYTPENMQQITVCPNDWNKHFKLMTDIDLSDYNKAQFNIIGNEEYPFTGSFDGNGHEISNFTYISPDQNNIGLFGRIEGPNSIIKNLTLVDSNIYGGDNTGAICGLLRGGEIANCYIEDGNITGKNNVGGLVGYNDEGLIFNCLSSADIIGNDNIGGLVGNNNGSISTSYATRSVTGKTSIGGLLGNNSAVGSVTNCYSISDINGVSAVGGIAGRNEGNISNCFSASAVPAIKNTSASKIYWTSMLDQDWINRNWMSGRISCSDIESGAEDIIVSNLTFPYEIALDAIGGKIYWTDSGRDYYRPGKIQRCNLDGSDVEYLVTGLAFPLGLALDLENSTIYWTNGSNRKIYRADLDGSNIEEVISTVGRPEEIVLDISMGKMYWLENYYLDDRIMRANFDGTNEEIVYNDMQGNAVGIAIDVSGGTIYWIDSGHSCRRGCSFNRIMRAKLDGTDVEELINDENIRRPEGFALDIPDGKIYWTDFRNRKIQRMNLDNNEIEDILTETSAYPISITLLPGEGGYSSGGLVGSDYAGSYLNNFWDNSISADVNGIGNKPEEPNVVGQATEQMQIESTFTDAGWDFVDVWKICETVDYPRLWLEAIDWPVIDEEPEMTFGYSNIISWQEVDEAVGYYVICCSDPNLDEVVMDSGWIDANEHTFEGLESGVEYYYAVKARKNCALESEYSDVVSSLQGTLGDAVEVMLDPNSLKNVNMANALSNKIDEVLVMIDKGKYKAALTKLEKDILKKTDGCANSGEPDKNDWIKTCEQQGLIYPLVIETIEYVENLME